MILPNLLHNRLSAMFPFQLKSEHPRKKSLTVALSEFLLFKYIK
jgi:hypothetical protein